MIDIVFFDMNANKINAYRSVLEGNIKGASFVQGTLNDVINNDKSINSIVSPANSYGWMNGGIDKFIDIWFDGIEQIVYNRIQQVGQYDNSGRKYLPVGKCEVVEKNGTMLFICPTMKVPMRLDTDSKNIFLAFYGLLQKHYEMTKNKVKVRLLCCALGTGVGGMDPTVSAQQILQSYEHFTKTYT